MNAEELRRQYSIAAIVPPKKSYGRYWVGLCPIHGDSHPSFEAWVTNEGEKWYCFVCGLGGDIVDLVGYLFVPGYDRRNHADLVQAAERLEGGAIKRVTPKTVKPVKPLPQYIWQKLLPMSDGVREYCNRRGISNQVISNRVLGSCISVTIDDNGSYVVKKAEHDPLLAIPYFVDGQLAGIKFRNTMATKENGHLRYWGIAGSKNALYAQDDVFMTEKRVYLVKGEIAKLVLESKGLLSCCTTTGEMTSQTEVFIPLSLADLVIIGDNDSTGRKSVAERSKLFPTAKVFFPPHGDIDSWMLEDKTSIDILQNL